ncbi:hypothetical protein [Cyanobium sp. ATX 6F1]|uniref:hypothetical protein n=1 Tax=Cyanobium sp. ATX 6F1 TaxID=2823702 RepID=UPI0020CBC1BA|nr:hypothetical protein [Cyanobium sp. ATX 6F1]MCP9917778.1 hypothetical protein [Cyanobium sp. ATX 6F1]
MPPRSSLALFLATAGLVAGVSACGKTPEPTMAPENAKPEATAPDQSAPTAKPHAAKTPGAKAHDEGKEGGEGGEGGEG